MPLSIAERAAPHRDDVGETFLLEAIDGETLVTVMVPFETLRAMAIKDGLRKDLHTEDLLRRYKRQIAKVASEQYEAGKWVTAGRHRTLRIDALG